MMQEKEYFPVAKTSETRYNREDEKYG